MTIVCIDLQNLAIVNKYPGDLPTQSTWGGPMGDPSVVLHVSCTDLDPEVVMAIRTDDGTVTLIEDPVKVQARSEAAWASLRTERNRRLAATDWTQLQDTHMSDAKKTAWADYRQELRDLPDEITDPTNVTWPVDPTVIPPTPVTGSRFDNILGNV